MRRFRRRMLVLVAAFGIIAGPLLVPVLGLAALPAMQDEITCASPDVVTFPEAASFMPATPIATPLAGPVASPAVVPVGDEVGDAATAQIDRLVRAIAVCQDERRARTLTQFVTERYLGDLYAGGGEITREQFIELARTLPRVPVEIVSVSDVHIGAGQRASADVVWTVSRQLLRATWTFVFVPRPAIDATGREPDTGIWMADGLSALPVEAPATANVVDVTLDEYVYRPSSLTVRGPDLVLSADNVGDEDHELLVLRVSPSVSTRDLLTAAGPAFPRGISVIGQATIPAGEAGQLVLVGVEPGDYVIVDLLLNPDGTPHLSLGMEASLTVQ